MRNKKIVKFIKENAKQCNELIDQHMTTSFIRGGFKIKPDDVLVCMKLDATHFHKLPMKMITNEMILASIENYEKRLAKGEKVQSYGEVIFNRHFEVMCKRDTKEKNEQLKHLREKVQLFVGMQNDESYHDYKTDFSENVCFYTLHSMVYTNWLNHVEPVMQISKQSFTEWLESPESDHFVVTCWIALAVAQKAIETPRADHAEPLHYTTNDIHRYASIVELEALQDEIQRIEDESNDRQETIDSNSIDLHFHKKKAEELNAIIDLGEAA